MKLSIGVISLFLVVSCAPMNKNIIPHSWLTEMSSINDIHKVNNNICKLKERLSKDIKANKGVDSNNGQPSKCIKETANPFDHDLAEGYKVYKYKIRDSRRIETGYALVINNNIVDSSS